jgi:hypothetical protein
MLRWPPGSRPEPIAAWRCGGYGEAFAVECDIMCHADVGGTASASCRVGPDCGTIADHPQAKTSG